MATTVRVTKTKETVHIFITGRFDFNCHQEFRRSYEGATGASEYVVDLSETEYMDSSALGMLLLLRESAGNNAAIKLANCRPSVRRILEIANFQSLFPIS
jgi:anti-anti-sigma factor